MTTDPDFVRIASADLARLLAERDRLRAQVDELSKARIEQARETGASAPEVEPNEHPYGCFIDASGVYSGTRDCEGDGHYVCRRCVLKRVETP